MRAAPCNPDTTIVVEVPGLKGAVEVRAVENIDGLLAEAKAHGGGPIEAGTHFDRTLISRGMVTPQVTPEELDDLPNAVVVDLRRVIAKVSGLELEAPPSCTRPRGVLGVALPDLAGIARHQFTAAYRAAERRRSTARPAGERQRCEARTRTRPRARARRARPSRRSRSAARAGPGDSAEGDGEPPPPVLQLVPPPPRKSARDTFAVLPQEARS